MAIHTLSIGGTSYVIEPKYASSAGYATTAGRADYAEHASRAAYAASAEYAGIADQAGMVMVSGNNTSTNFPLLLASSVAVTAGAAKTLYTDTANSLHYNPSTNVLTAPSFNTSALGVSGGVTIYNGSNFNLRASSTASTDPGDIIFCNHAGLELGRFWLDRGLTFMLRYGSSDDAKEIIHSGNIGSQSVAYATQANVADYAVTAERAFYAVTANRAQYATTAGHARIANNANSAGSAVTSDYAITASNAIAANFAASAGRAAYASSAGYASTAGYTNFANYVRTNQSTSTFYIVGTTTSSSATTGYPLIKNSAVKVQSNAVYASAGFYESSDARLKTITNDVEVDFERLKSIPKIQYIKKGETAPHIGTIAQDLQKVYPEFVEIGDDGYMSVDYAKLSIIPLKAVDLLYDEVNKLKDEIKTVKEENQMLKDRLDNIEALINK